MLGTWDNNAMNNFPHAYLTSTKETMPICLVHIFTAIATRLGLNVSPINFPGTVLAHVLPRHEGAEPIIVNASVANPTNFILNTQISLQGIHLAAHFQSLQPCTGLRMLLRASRNILSSLMNHDVPLSVLHPSLLLSICVHLLFQADNDILDRLFSDVYLQALDCILLLGRLAPSLTERCQAKVRLRCQTVLDEEAAEELKIRRRTGKPVIKYFVGMAFVHARYKYIGFIYGWDVSSYSFFLLYPSADKPF